MTDLKRVLEEIRSDAVARNRRLFSSGWRKVVERADIAVREASRLEATAAAWEFIALSYELKAAGLWDDFAARNRDVLAEIRKKIEEAG